ncbi:MAG: hypothetical protein JSV45_03435 [Chromatiales bacterium]|nr:MAG: hypothetical protein JSV45_03435 [Chromatiales bacterium]
MATDSHDQLRSAIRSIVSPIIQFLLEAGVGFKEFSQITKAEFVQVASKVYGVRGRPTNISRVAVMTGLTRKEIRSIRQTEEATEADTSMDIDRLNPATIVLHSWHSDPLFLDEKGDPKALVPTGKSPSFSDLCKRYGGDIPAGAMLAELRRAGSVSESSDGRIRPVSRYYTPTVFNERFIGSMAFSLGNLAKTLMTNATYSRRSDTDDLKNLGLMERYVWSTHLSDDDVAEFKLLAEKKSAELLAELDTWIGNRETKKIETGDSTRDRPQPSANRLVGLGVYLFENESHKEAQR